MYEMIVDTFGLVIGFILFMNTKLVTALYKLLWHTD
jgi:hypothetical protein